MRSYEELLKLDSFAERLEYLRLYSANPSNANRNAMNRFYKSKAWIHIRDQVIKRDLGCDLGIEEFGIMGQMIVHHINPITEEDVELGSDLLFDMNNLITVSTETHNRIHYLDEEVQEYVERKPGDTKLW